MVAFEELSGALFVFDEQFNARGVAQCIDSVFEFSIERFLVVVERQETVDSRIEIEEHFGVDADAIECTDGFFAFAIIRDDAAIHLHSAIVVFHLLVCISGVV